MNQPVKKFVIDGWTYGEPPMSTDRPKHSNDPYVFPDIFRSKGTKCDWAQGSWPPIKVRVTIEYFV